MADDLFAQAGEPAAPTGDKEVQDFLDKYVGEGKRYKSVEELAKGKAHADDHIKTLEGELGSLREFMTAQFEQLGKREVIPNNQPNEADEGRSPAPAAPPKNVEEDDIDARIAKAMEERDENTRLKKNADLTQEVMIEHFGGKEDAVKAIQDKAAEMGVSAQFLADAAFRSPKAFFNLMGINPDEKPRSSASPSPSSDVNPRVLANHTPGQAKPGTYEYYENLRKTDKNRYWSAGVQAQLMKDALANPEAFFKR